MMREPESGAEIPASLARERAAVETLVAALALDRKALGAGDIDHLERTAPRKRELLMAVASADEQRNRLLERTGVGSGRVEWKHGSAATSSIPRRAKTGMPC